MPQVPCVCLTCHQSFTAHACHVRSGSGKYCSVPCYRQRPVPALADRFWALVLKTDDCWIWQGERTRYGYGRCTVGKKQRMPAHRVAYELTYGMILPGLLCCHRCDVPLCCNPAHLWLGTNADNLRDMFAKQRDAAHTNPTSFARGDRHGRRVHPEKFQRGEQSHHAKLTERAVREIREQYATGQWSLQRLAVHFGVSRTLIRKVVIRETWRHIS